MRHSLWFKTVCVVLIAAFLSLDVAWAYPSENSSPKSQNLATESIFAENTATDATKARQSDIHNEYNFAASILSICNFLFNQQKIVSLLEPVMKVELAGSKDILKDIDLSGVTAFSMSDGKFKAIAPDKKLAKDSIVLVPYTRNGKEFTLQIALKENPVAASLAGSKISEPSISDLFEIRLASGRLGEPRIGVVEEASLEPASASGAAVSARAPPEPASPTTLYGVEPFSLLSFLSVLGASTLDFVIEHPYSSIAIGAGIVVGTLAIRAVFKKKAPESEVSAIKQLLIPNFESSSHNRIVKDSIAPEPQKSALVIGAGRIGRGLIGRILNDSGYKITFVNRSEEIVNRLNADKKYNLDIIDIKGKKVSRTINNVDAIARVDVDKLSEALKNTNLVFVSVFDQDFEDVALMLARGMEVRVREGIEEPLNVVIVSNRYSTKYKIREDILSKISPVVAEKADANLGIVDAITFDIIPDVPDDIAKKDPTLIQAYSTLHNSIYGDVRLIVESNGFKGGVFKLKGMTYADSVRRKKIQKLFVFNGAHAICAYLGHLKKYKYIQDAVRDPDIRKYLDNAFKEIEGLLGDWPDYEQFTKMVIKGLEDDRFKDDIRRVGRDPIRKLASYDRLVGPARLIVDSNRSPDAYASGIAASILYNDPDDAESVSIQKMLAEDGGLNKVIIDKCHLSPNYDAVLIKLIKEKFHEMRKEKAKAELKKFMEDGLIDEKQYDNMLQISEKLPKKVKLIVWDFDNVVGNTQQFYAAATAIVYWRIVSGIKDADAMPKSKDPILQEGRDVYKRLLPNGPATWLTIKEAMEKARKSGVKESDLLSESDYYEQFTHIRKDIFSALNPSEFFNSRMREFLSIVRVLNPEAEFCVNTALDKDFFEQQFVKHGFRGYFSSWKALTAEERKSGTNEVAKVDNLMKLIKEKGITNPAEVVVIDDSIKLMRALALRESRVYRIGVAIDIKSGMELVDGGVNAVFMNMKPTAQKLAMFGIDKKKAEIIKNVAPDVYIIKAPGTKAREGKIDQVLNDMYSHKIPLPPVRDEKARKEVEQAFEALVLRGDIKPKIIVNIKDFSPNAVSFYMEELKKMSEYYNGNVTFVLVVESDVTAYRHDMPSVFNALVKARSVLGVSFDDKYTMMIADGGRKLRNMPLTLAYLYEGLMPYSDERIRLHEVFVRTGGLLMQMPHYGEGDMPVVASDSLFNSENIMLNDGRPLSKMTHDRKIVVPEIPLKASDLSGKIVRGADDADKTKWILAKPTTALVDEFVKRSKVKNFYGLHFLTVWNRRFLGDFMNTMQDTKMENERPFLDMPCDMFMLIFQSASMSTVEWLKFKPESVTETDWQKAREIAIKYFGENAHNAKFVKMEAENAFTDEGILSTSLPRFRSLISDEANIVKKSPRVKLANATMASLDHVIILGEGEIHFGKDVKLSNVTIQMNGEKLVIPDGWTIDNSFIRGNCNLTGSKGYLLNGIKEENGKLSPLDGVTLPGDAVTTVISTLGQGEIVVTVPINASKTELADMRFGRDNLSLMSMQIDMDISANLKRIRKMEDITKAEFSEIKIFPLRKDAVNEKKRNTRYRYAVSMISHQITKGLSKKTGQYWVSIEGIQGAGKTYMIEALSRALKRKGRNVVVIEEDWYHLPRDKRDKKLAKITNLGIKGGALHAEKWHRWPKLREDLEKIKAAGSGPVEIKLTDIYQRDSGGVINGEKDIVIKPDTVFIYSGFYVSDIGKVKIAPDLSIYLGISQEESLKVKLMRDKWRSRRDILNLDRDIYHPAFFRYISTYDPAASSDYVLRFDSLIARSTGKVSIVTPRTRANGRISDQFSLTEDRANRRRESLHRLYLVKKKELAANNTRAKLVETGNRIVSAFITEPMKSRMQAHITDIDMPTAEIQKKLKRLIALVKSIYSHNEENMLKEISDDMEYLQNTIENLEAESLIVSIIIKARRAKKEGKNLVIALETDWIPGMNDKTSLQYGTVNPIIRGIEDISLVLRSLNIDNVEIVHSRAGDLAHDIISRVAPKEGGAVDFSNVVILASAETVTSESFYPLINSSLDKKPFLAQVNAYELRRWYKDNPYATSQIDVKLIEMLSTALELSVGLEPPKVPLLTSYDREKRIAVFTPKAIRVELEDLRKTYELQRRALMRMA